VARNSAAFEVAWKEQRPTKQVAARGIILKTRDREASSIETKGSRVSDSIREELVQNRDSYVTPGEAARCLHVSPKTINRWANEGLLPCVITLGGHRRFRRDDVDVAVAQMSVRGSNVEAKADE
jgi:excisionase family DNA binding protein